MKSRAAIPTPTTVAADASARFAPEIWRVTLCFVAAVCVSIVLSGCLGMGGGDKSSASTSVDGELPSNPSHVGESGVAFTSVSATAGSSPASSEVPTPAPNRGSTASMPGHARIQPHTGPSLASPGPGLPKETVMAAKPVPTARAQKEDVRRAAPVVDTQAPPLNNTAVASGGTPKRAAGGLSRSSSVTPSTATTSIASTAPSAPPPTATPRPVKINTPAPQAPPTFDYTPPTATAGGHAKKGPRTLLSISNPSEFGSTARNSGNSYAQAPTRPLPKGEGNDPRFGDGNAPAPQYNTPPPSSSSYGSRSTPRYQPAPPPSDEPYRESIAGADNYSSNSGDSQLPTNSNPSGVTTTSSRQSPAPPPMLGGPEFRRVIAPNDQEVAVITTPFGDVVVQLDAQAAPHTVANFTKLISEGFYDGTNFHRTIPNFVIQGGDPNSKFPDRSKHGLGGPDWTVPAEIGLKHVRGAIAMARNRDAVNPSRASNGSQFYICVNNNPALNNKYTVFGHVIKGMEVVDAISNQPRDNRDNPLENIKMQVVMKKRSDIQGLQ